MNEIVLISIIGVLFFIIIFMFLYMVLPYIRLQQALKSYKHTRKIEDLFYTNWVFWPELQLLFRDMELIIKSHSDDTFKRKQAEYLALQNQINPHFLYNTLEAIRGDAVLAGMDRIADTTRALAIFFRYTITEVEHLVTLEDELDNAENYFTIQQYRFGNKLEMDVEIPDGNYDLLQAKLPKLTLQPIIENAIYHGLERKVGVGNVRIIIESTSKNLLIRIKDDGIGISKSVLDELNQIFKNQDKTVASYSEPRNKKGGIALPNVNSRIKLLFGEDYGIHILSVEEVGTEVNIVLPLNFESGQTDERRNFANT